MPSVKKNFFYNLLLLLSNLLFPIINFAYASRILGPAGIGKVQFIITFATYFVLIAQLGIPVYGMREVAKAKGDRQKLSRLFSELLVINIVSSILMLLVYLVLILTLPWFRDSLNYYLLASLLVLSGFSVLEWFYQGMEHFRFLTLRSVVIKTLILAGLLLFVRSSDDLMIYFLLTLGATLAINGNRLYQPKKDEWRFLSGIIVTYQPRWVPGLFLGATRSIQQYHTSVGVNLIDYFPVFMPYGLYVDGGDNRPSGQSRLYSFFMRWLWEKGHGEIYFEYGRNGYFWDTRDLKVEPSSTGAFLVGFKKLVPLINKKGEYLQIMSEFTQLAFNPTTFNRDGYFLTSWYTDGTVRAGYTHEGQLLGSGLGPGGNMQTVEVDWVKSLKMLGIRFERQVHNNDFFFLYIKDYRRNWVDVSVSLLGNWTYKNLLFHGQLQYVRSLNYEWQFTPPETDYWGPGLDVTNFYMNVGVVYRF